MYNELDPVLSTPVRLAIVSALVKLKQADFNYLMEVTGTTQGNMSSSAETVVDGGICGGDQNIQGQLSAYNCEVDDEGEEGVRAVCGGHQKISSFIRRYFF